ncbi:hypothetical protein ACQPZJ_11575 [Actinoplanes sp. CA-054009]
MTPVLDADEAARPSVVMWESISTLSRAEFYIRVGASSPNVDAVAQEVYALAEGKSDGFDLRLAAGVEQEENPRRPRRGAGQ